MSTVFTATTKAAEAPEVEAGFYDARFDGVTVKFVTGGQYGDGDRYEWAFTLLDDDGEVLEDRGEPIELTGLSSMSTNLTSSTTPRAVKYLKALMTADEFADFEAGKGIDAEALIERVVQVEVIIKDSGWPAIANVLPKRKARAGRRS